MASSNRLPPLKALKMFEVVARHLNFRLAADEIGVTQGAVAQQIRGLEDILTVKLFNRLPRGLSLTDEGEQYVHKIREAFNLIQDATENLTPSKAIVNISLTPSFATKWFLPRLGEFAETHPDIDVRILATETQSNFISDNIDIAVRQGKPPFAAHLQADLLFPMTYIAVCSPQYREKVLPNGAFVELDEATFLFDAHDHWSEFLTENVPTHKFKFHNAMTFNQTALAIDAAIAHQGVALVSEILAGADLESGRLCRPFSQKLQGDTGYYLLSNRQSQSKMATNLTHQWLLDQVR